MNEEQVSESNCSRAFCERNQEGMKAALIYVANPLGLVIRTDGDGDGDVKPTTPQYFSITFLSLITLFLRPIIHRSAFARPWPLLPIFTSNYSGISAIFR